VAIATESEFGLVSSVSARQPPDDCSPAATNSSMTLDLQEQLAHTSRGVLDDAWLGTIIPGIEGCIEDGSGSDVTCLGDLEKRHDNDVL
jgi:hypothetical protein